MAQKKMYYGAKGLIALAKDQEKRMRRAVKTMDDAVKWRAAEGVKDSIELTGGTLTRSETRGQYARGRSAGSSTSTGRKRGRAPSLPINQVSHKLRRSFNRKKKSHQVYEVVSRGIPYAKYILSESGTRKMVTRPLKKEVVKRGKARLYAIRKMFGDSLN